MVISNPIEDMLDSLAKSTCTLSIKPKDLFLVLGFDPDESFEISEKGYEISCLYLRICHTLNKLFNGNKREICHWFYTWNEEINGSPIEKMKSIEGLVLVLHYITKQVD